MRLLWTALLALCVLSGCSSKEINALELRPLTTYTIDQDDIIQLSKKTKEQILTYCERQPTEILPPHRAEVTKIIFRHPIYRELGSKTIKYWVSGDERFISCANSDEQIERTFSSEPIEEFEAIIPDDLIETDVESAVTFYPGPDAEEITATYRINEEHETVIPNSIYRYKTPESGSLYVTFEVIQNGRKLDRTIEPGVFLFESSKNEGFAFLTKLADNRVSLQMGPKTSWDRIVLPSTVAGEYVYTDSSERGYTLKDYKRQLIKRIIVSDQPINNVEKTSSYALSKEYGIVIEMWGNVRRPLTSTMMSVPSRPSKTKLATYEFDGQLSHLDGPHTHDLFDLLSRVVKSELTDSAKPRGTVTLYEGFTEQQFEVWGDSTSGRLFVVDIHTNQTFEIDKNQLEVILHMSIL